MAPWIAKEESEAMTASGRLARTRSATALAVADTRWLSQALALLVALAVVEAATAVEAAEARAALARKLPPATTTTTTTRPPATTTTTTAVPPPPLPAPVLVKANGSQLMLGGAPYRFTGINAYNLATDWSVNYGCGAMVDDQSLDSFFASLRPDSMVRLWAFQRQVFNKNTGQLDFGPLDRVVNAAARRGQRVILTLANQWTGCDDGFAKVESWYAGGYRVAASTDGASPLSYWDYIHQIVPRYAGSPTVGMWELVNEPEAPITNPDGSPGCTATAPITLRSFFDTVGGEVHRLDPGHLIGSGVIGGGQCGAQGDSYRTLHASPGIDVASYHDYNHDAEPMPGDIWNGLKVRLDQAAALNKPLIVGEAGILASNSVGGCVTTAQRRDKFRAKLDAQFPAGIDGVLPWAEEYSTPTACAYGIVGGSDPTTALLHDYPL